MFGGGFVSVCSFCLILVLFSIRTEPSLNHENLVTNDVTNGKAHKVTNHNELSRHLLGKNHSAKENSQGGQQPLFVSSFPHDMKTLDVATKKKVFINTLLPISLAALAEIEQEKNSLEAILVKLEGHGDVLYFDETTSWPESIVDSEIKLLEQLTLKYRTNSKKMLVDRIDVLPVSLILAQGALESSWGSSRFASVGNNLFGIWTWGEKGIIPEKRAKGSSHKVAVYDSLLDSVRAYILLLNRLPAYASLRKLRSQSDSSVTLADGLLYYSERRGDYIKDVKQIIKNNDLEKLDSLRITEDFQWEPPDSLRLVSINGVDNAKL